MLAVTPRSWPLLVVDVSILSYMVVFSFATLSHCAIMWQLRKDFAIGVRSPVLAIVSGMAALLITNLSVFQRTLDYKQEVGAEMLFFLPVSLTFTTTYILRGLRLLALYNPDPNSRQRSIKYLKEWFFVKILLAVFLTVEGAMWAFVPTYGINTVVSQMKFVTMLDISLNVAASAGMYRKISETHDIFNMSKEMLTVGRYMAAAWASAAVFLAVSIREPPDGDLFHVVHFSLLAVRFHTAIWHTNIKPVRDILRRNNEQQNRKVPWLPYVPLYTSTSSKVAVGMPEDKTAVTSKQTEIPRKWVGLGPLEHIMNYPPLLRAFSDFCQRALCCESLMFLREVANFRRLSAAGADEDICFQMFLAIVSEFVESGSTFEVNISVEAKDEIMGYFDEAIFTGLDKETRDSAFAAAEEEISKLLTNNVLEIFQATEIYQTLARQLQDISLERPA